MTTFRTISDVRGNIIECEIAGQIGRARVMSDGADKAKLRAEAQATRLAAGVAIQESLRGPA